MFNPDAFQDPQRGNVTYVDLWQLQPDTLAERLEIMYNTLVQVTYALGELTGASIPSGANSAPATLNATEATIMSATPDGQYRCSWGWFAALLRSLHCAPSRSLRRSCAQVHYARAGYDWLRIFPGAF